MEIVTKESLLAKIKALQESLKNSQIARLQNSSLNGLQKKTTKVEDFDKKVKKDSTKKNRKPKIIQICSSKSVKSFNKSAKSFDKILDKAVEKASEKSEKAVEKIVKSDNGFAVYEINSGLAQDLWNKFGFRNGDDATKKNHFACNNLSYQLKIEKPLTINVKINNCYTKKNLLCGYAVIKSDGNKVRLMGCFK